MHKREHFLRQRNQEIGAVLEQARRMRGRTIGECALLLKTTHRRYIAIERGATPVTFAEMELLIPYFDLEELVRTQEMFSTTVRAMLGLFSTASVSDSYEKSTIPETMSLTTPEVRRNMGTTSDDRERKHCAEALQLTYPE